MILNNSKFLLIFLFFIINISLLVNLIYSITYISEINFQDQEFIEIYSNENLNFNNSIFYDSSNTNYSKKLILIQNRSSNFYLITANNFLKNNNFSKLNCTIFSTNQNSLGYYGLKNSAEDIFIKINSLYNLSWQKEVDLQFNNNQSLNFKNNSSTFIYNLSVCSFPTIINLTLTNLSKNISNISQTNLTQNISIISNITNIINTSKNITFDIISNLIFEDKITFKFDTNQENFIISYWIEDYDSNILKSARNTTNLNQKSYTPKTNSSKIFFIHAILYRNNTILQRVNKSIFYHKTKKIKKEKYISKFLIIPKTQIFNKTIQFKFDTNLKNYNITYWITDYFNSTLKPKKSTLNSNQKSFTPNLNYSQILILHGLIKTKNISIYNSTNIFYLSNNKFFNLSTKNSNQINKNLIHKKQYFNLSSFILYENLIFVTINSNIQNLTGYCYTNLKNTRISNIINISNINNFNNFKLELNNSILSRKIINSSLNSTLTLICRYKPIKNKNYYSFSFPFNYSIFNKISHHSSLNIIFKNISTSNNLLSTSFPKIQTLSTQKTPIIQESSKIYTSKNEIYSKNSYFFIFSGLILTFSIIIFFW